MNVFDVPPNLEKTVDKFTMENQQTEQLKANEPETVAEVRSRELVSLVGRALKRDRRTVAGPIRKVLALTVKAGLLRKIGSRYVSVGGGKVTYGNDMSDDNPDDKCAPCGGMRRRKPRKPKCRRKSSKKAKKMCCHGRSRRGRKSGKRGCKRQ